MSFKPAKTLKAFADHAMTRARWLGQTDIERRLAWHMSCNTARFHFDQELPKLRAMIAMGLDPMCENIGDSTSAVDMASGESRASPLLAFLLESTPKERFFRAEGMTPAMTAAKMQNHEGLALLAPRSSFEMSFSNSMPSQSPLTLSAESLSPRCVQICLENMAPDQILDQAMPTLRQLCSGLDFATKREENGLAKTLDFQGSGLCEQSPASRMLRIIDSLAQALPAQATAAWLQEKLGDDCTGAALEALASKLEAREIERASQAREASAPNQRARL